MTVVSSAALLSAARADSAADFYKGRNLAILVGSGAGGGYDTTTRLLARFWQKHIPGPPAVVVQDMPGAGGIKMQNYLDHQAPRDGSVVAATRAAFVAGPLIPAFAGSALGDYDPRNVNWIGNISGQWGGCFVWHTVPVKTIQDAMKTQVIIGSTSPRANSSTIAGILNALIGTKFKVVSGFSTSGTYLAMEQGEIQGSCVSYETASAAAPRLIDEGKLRFLIQIGLTRSKLQPDVPAVGELLTNEEDRQVVRLVAASLIMGRPYLAPPGVPKDRLAALRTSFMATMRDPAYVAAARKEKLIVDASDYKEMEALIADTYTIPEAAVKRTRTMLANAWKGSKKKDKKK
ncbi:MAG TPA: tripartite tricarboxylate transporter substrate-binding protein [Alphaproteobacteria bacterium]|nr:tripartite tricarboxylate transporter substrate-binding protein [Alphaproteobacteria bacterium]